MFNLFMLSVSHRRDKRDVLLKLHTFTELKKEKEAVDAPFEFGKNKIAFGWHSDFCFAPYYATKFLEFIATSKFLSFLFFSFSFFLAFSLVGISSGLIQIF